MPPRSVPRRGCLPPATSQEGREGRKEGTTTPPSYTPPPKGEPLWQTGAGGGSSLGKGGRTKPNAKHRLQMSWPGRGGPRGLQGRSPKAGGDAKAAELVSGSLFSGASCEETAVLAAATAAAAAAAALACRSARTALECLHLGELQRQLKYLALMFQNLSP